MIGFIVALVAVWLGIGFYLAYAERRYWLEVSRRIGGGRVQYYTPWLEVGLLTIIKPIEMSWRSGREFNYHVLGCLAEWKALAKARRGL